MASPAPAPDVSVTSSSGFVAVVDTPTSIWDKSSSVNFLLFMSIGFCTTLGFLAVVIVFAFYLRRHLRRRRARFQGPTELAVAVQEPKKLFVVIHPGGSADVAHQEDDDTPRKFVFLHDPIALHSTVINMEDMAPNLGDKIPAFRQDECEQCKAAEGAAPEQPVKHKNSAVEIYPLQDSAREVFPLQDTARNQSYPRRGPPPRSSTQDHSQHPAGSGGVSGVGREQPGRRRIQAAEREAPVPLGLSGGRREERPAHLSRRANLELLLTSRSAASEEYVEDVQLLSQRFLP